MTWADIYNLGGKTNLGILVDAGYQFSRFGIDDLENDITDPSNLPLVPNSIKDYQFRYYDYERDRAGIGANINLDLDRDNKLYANVMYSGYDEYRDPVWHTEYKNIDAVAGDNAVVNADGSITIPDVTAGKGLDVIDPAHDRRIDEVPDPGCEGVGGKTNPWRFHLGLQGQLCLYGAVCALELRLWFRQPERDGLIDL